MKKLAALAVVLLIYSGAAEAQAQGCQGRDLQEAVAIIQAAHQGGMQLAYANIDFNTKMAKMVQLIQYLNRRASQLPYACQVLITAWSNSIAGQMGNGGGGGGTQCMSGVCCDDSGCYGG